MPKQKQYRVADRGMGDVRMVATATREWFAGDSINRTDLSAEAFAAALAEGVIEEIESDADEEAGE